MGTEFQFGKKNKFCLLHSIVNVNATESYS